jgi:pyrroloquinoline quinone (PQQ) biosynthesis protein C
MHFEADPESFHRRLTRFNTTRLAASQPGADWELVLDGEHAFRLQEGRFLEALRRDVAGLLPAPALDADAFVAWFESLAHTGPGQGHRLFPWLAESASMDQMRWFLAQEAAGEAGFDDLLAMTQVKLPVRAKLECARNYWDEMGHGKQNAMHGQMLETMVRELGLAPDIDTTVWESLALANTMLGLAANRRYAWQSLGALGAIELTAPGRVAQVSAGMKRLGLDGRMRAYFDLHAALDKAHARAWIAEIIRPAVQEEPGRALHIAEGALMRLVCGQRCFERYQRELCQPALAH